MIVAVSVAIGPEPSSETTRYETSVQNGTPRILLAPSARLERADGAREPDARIHAELDVHVGSLGLLPLDDGDAAHRVVEARRHVDGPEGRRLHGEGSAGEEQQQCGHGRSSGSSASYVNSRGAPIRFLRGRGPTIPAPRSKWKVAGPPRAHRRCVPGATRNHAVWPL